MMKLPKTHKPQVLRERKKKRPIRYDIGVEDEYGDIGMTGGPYNKIENALNTVPFEDNSVLVKFAADCEELLYRWNKDKEQWEKE